MVYTLSKSPNKPTLFFFQDSAYTNPPFKKKKGRKKPNYFFDYIYIYIYIYYLFILFFAISILRKSVFFFPKKLDLVFFFLFFVSDLFFCNSVWKWTKYFCVCLFLYIAEMGLPPFDYFKIVCCSGSYPTWFPTLPCDAWNYCSHPFCSRSPDGRRKCKARGENHYADISCLSLTEYGGRIVVFVEREGGGDPDTSLCCWSEHVAPEFVWHSFACCYWRLLHLCPNHNFNYPCWSI